MKIGALDANDRVVIIAEIGNNHEGDFALAEELIGLAAEAGAHAVKFQAITPDRLVAATDSERLAQLEKFRFTPDQFARLADVARAAGVEFLCTPFDEAAVAFLEPLVPAYKIASGDNDCVPLLRAVAATGKPVIVSTGLAELETLSCSCAVLEEVWRATGAPAELALLHCVVSYPTATADAQLARITALARLGHTVGYSDHTLGIDAAVLSVALGARIVEKHFTIAKDHSEFRDHRLSADPAELATLVARIAEAEAMLALPSSRPEGEIAVREAVRRGVYAARNLAAGETVAACDLVCLRPMRGVPAADHDRAVGRTLSRSVAQGAALTWDDFA